MNLVGTERSLDWDSFVQTQLLGINPEVDLFAMVDNHKLPVNVCPLSDPFTAKTVFFLLRNLLSAVLCKLDHYSGQVVMIAPFR